MSHTKRYLEELQQRWAVDLFVRDGCPLEVASNMSYDDAVEAFFDGNDEEAFEVFSASDVE